MRERGRNIDVTEKHWWVASHMQPYQESKSQPRYVPWPDSNLQLFGIQGNAPTNVTTQPGPNAILHFVFLPLKYVVHEQVSLSSNTILF